MLVVDGVTDCATTATDRLKGEAVAVIACGLNLQIPQTDLNRTGVTAAATEAGLSAACFGFRDHRAGLTTPSTDRLQQESRTSFAAGEHR